MSSITYKQRGRRRSVGAHRASRSRSFVRSVQRNHLARNSFLVTLNTVITGLFGFAYWGVAAHNYSAHTIGVATALIAAMNLMSLIGTLGIGQTALQRLPKANDDEWSRLVNVAVFAGRKLA